MNGWSFDITQQGNWDLWSWLCIAAALALGAYILFGRLHKRPGGWVALVLASIGIVGTAAVLGMPALRDARTGLFWSFILLCLLSATFYINLADRLKRRQIAILLTLRILALALMVTMLFAPVFRYVSHPKPTHPLILIVDTSGSMSFPDKQNGLTRIAAVWRAVDNQLPKIRQSFIPSVYTFSTSAQPLKKPEDLAHAVADGKATDLAAGINAALSGVSAPDAQFVLFSDGIDNTTAAWAGDSPDVAHALRSTDRPINTIRVGSDQAEPSNLANIAVADVDAPDDCSVGHESQISATIKSSALSDRVIDVKMAEVNDAGKPTGAIATTSLVLKSTPNGQVVKLPYKPASAGLHKLAVWVDPVPGERSIIDNRQDFQLLALDPRLKVLYVEGSLRPEYRELRRALIADQYIEVATLLRIRENEFRSSGSVDGKPFDLGRLPQSFDEWRKFDVIIIGDLNISFLDSTQQNAIEKAVSDGAGLLMIGGEHTLGPGGYQGTPIEKALPVLVGGEDSPQEKQQFVPQLTAQGVAHPAMEGLEPWFGTADKEPTKALPQLRGNVVVAGPKTGAQVLLVHPDRLGPDKKPQIVLAVETYGKGRSAVFTVDTTNLWALPLRAMGQESPFNRFWGQLVRWLAGADALKRQHGPGIDGILNKSIYQLGEDLRLRAQVRDKHGDATAYAQASVTLKNADGSITQTLDLSPVGDQTGMYNAFIPHQPKGDYTLDLVASQDGKELGHQQIKFTVIAPADEMFKLAANPALLKAIADQTGSEKRKGAYRDLGQFGDLVDALIANQQGPLGPTQVAVPLDNIIRTTMVAAGHDPGWKTVYDLPIQAGLVILLLTIEWICRRKWQLQ